MRKWERKLGGIEGRGRQLEGNTWARRAANMGERARTMPLLEQGLRPVHRRLHCVDIEGGNVLLFGKPPVTGRLKDLLRVKESDRRQMYIGRRRSAQWPHGQGFQEGRQRCGVPSRRNGRSHCCLICWSRSSLGEARPPTAWPTGRGIQGPKPYPRCVKFNPFIPVSLPSWHPPFKPQELFQGLCLLGWGIGQEGAIGATF